MFDFRNFPQIRIVSGVRKKFQPESTSESGVIVYGVFFRHAGLFVRKHVHHLTEDCCRDWSSGQV